MQNQQPLVQRYRRTNQDRLGEWQSLDSNWKTAASAGLVGHDIYHHLPNDSGTFFEEVATLGAEWYVDMQPIDKPFSSLSSRTLERFERNVVDTVLNALDSKETHPFCLPVHPAARLTDVEMALFHLLAVKAQQTLDKSTDLRTFDRPDFLERFVQGVLWGYEQARGRFPDQNAVRTASLEFRNTLADLSESEVPVGHVVTLTLEGHTCSLTYDDADADFLQSTPVVEAFLMVWCSGESGFPAKRLTLHVDERSYVNFVDEHFAAQDNALLSDDEQLIPRDERTGLHKVYVRSPAVQQSLQENSSLALPLSAYHSADFTPRQVPVF